MHSVKILADSISASGNRLTTVEATYPRIIHAEIMTHRVFSRNAASSRAIPVQKMIKNVLENPYIPSHWGKNQKGMQAYYLLEGEDKQKAIVEWLKARDKAVMSAQALLDIGVHKQLTNRLLEPFQWYTTIISATDWDNFFNLRDHSEAHPDIRLIASKIKESLNDNSPTLLGENEWHLPLIFEKDLSESINDLKKIATGRCARVSYLTHDGNRDLSKDIELHDRLLKSCHMSPFEHIATPINSNDYIGNFKGWKQYRKFIPNESNALGIRK